MTRTLIPFAALLIAAAPAGGGGSGYAVTGHIAGPDGRWDYSRVDPVAHRLYVARGDSVTVIDLASGKALPSIGAISRGHAVIPIDATPLLLVTSGGDDSVRLIDTGSGKEVARIAVGSDPDAAVYDPKTGKAYVMNAKTGSVSVIDVARRAVGATIMLKPGLESAALAQDHRLFIANEDAGEIETIDTASGRAGAPVALPGCEGPAGLGYDAPTRQLIASCTNGKAAIVDLRGGKVRLVDIGKGPDAVIVDGKHRRAFIPCGRDATLAVIDLDTKGGAAVSATVATEVGARSGAVDASDGAIYLPTATFGPAPAAGGRPQAIAGSFHVLIVRPAKG